MSDKPLTDISFSSFDLHPSLLAVAVERLAWVASAKQTAGVGQFRP